MRLCSQTGKRNYTASGKLAEAVVRGSPVQLVANSKQDELGIDTAPYCLVFLLMVRLRRQNTTHQAGGSNRYVGEQAVTQRVLDRPEE